MDSEKQKRHRVSYFPGDARVRLAPLHEALIQFCLTKSEQVFKTESDFIRVAITRYAKDLLTQEEFSFVCERVASKTARDGNK